MFFDLSKLIKDKSLSLWLHSIRVSKLAKEIGVILCLSEKEINELIFASILHDLGKIYLPYSLFTFKRDLSKKEIEEIKKHPILGYELICKVEKDSKEISLAVKHHHERYDGNGYPDGLKGKEIPLYSRVITLADSWDAMVSNRSYNKKFSKEDAIEEILKNSGIQFDPVLVELFLKNNLLSDP